MCSSFHVQSLEAFGLQCGSYGSEHGSFGSKYSLVLKKNIAFSPFYKHVFKIALEVVVGNYGFIFVLKPLFRITVSFLY